MRRTVPDSKSLYHSHSYRTEEERKWVEGVPLGLSQKLTNKVLVSCAIPLLFLYMYIHVASALCTYIFIHITCRLEHQMDV